MRRYLMMIVVSVLALITGAAFANGPIRHRLAQDKELVGLIGSRIAIVQKGFADPRVSSEAVLEHCLQAIPAGTQGDDCPFGTQLLLAAEYPDVSKALQIPRQDVLDWIRKQPSQAQLNGVLQMDAAERGVYIDPKTAQKMQDFASRALFGD